MVSRPVGIKGVPLLQSLSLLGYFLNVFFGSLWHIFSETTFATIWKMMSEWVTCFNLDWYSIKSPAMEPISRRRQTRQLPHLQRHWKRRDGLACRSLRWWKEFRIFWHSYYWTVRLLDKNYSWNCSGLQMNLTQNDFCIFLYLCHMIWQQIIAISWYCYLYIHCS